MDSVTLLWEVSKTHDVYALSFDYGQKHAKELEAAKQLAAMARVRGHKVVDLSPLGALLDSALTVAHHKVPEGHHTDAAMAANTVPNRNMIMLAVGVGWAQVLGAQHVAYGAEDGEHSLYHDCRPEFVIALSQAAQLSSEYGPQVVAPYLDQTKADILKLGMMLKVPYERTWSCYKGGELHCGRCGACSKRKEAFRAAGVPDPTQYEEVHHEF